MVNWASVISSSVTPEAEQPGPHPNQDSTCENALPTKVPTNCNGSCPDVSRCAQCGEREDVGSVVVPFGNEESGHTWLHPECWNFWNDGSPDMTNSPSEIHLIYRVRLTSEHTTQITSVRLGSDYEGEAKILDEGVDEHSMILGRRVHWRIEQRSEEKLYCSRFKMAIEEFRKKHPELADHELVRGRKEIDVTIETEIPENGSYLGRRPNGGPTVNIDEVGQQWIMIANENRRSSSEGRRVLRKNLVGTNKKMPKLSLKASICDLSVDITTFEDSEFEVCMELKDAGILVVPKGPIRWGIIMREHKYLGRIEFKLPRRQVEDALQRNPELGAELPTGDKTVFVVIEAELSRDRASFIDLMMSEYVAAGILNLLTTLPDEATGSLGPGHPGVN